MKFKIFAVFVTVIILGLMLLGPPVWATSPTLSPNDMIVSTTNLAAGQTTICAIAYSNVSKAPGLNGQDLVIYNMSVSSASASYRSSAIASIDITRTYFDVRTIGMTLAYNSAEAVALTSLSGNMILKCPMVRFDESSYKTANSATVSAVAMPGFHRRI